MDRELAIRIDGMLMNIRGSLDCIAHYLKNNLSEEEFGEYIKFVGESMGVLVDFSRSLHKLYPDIVPKELVPPSRRKRRNKQEKQQSTE